MLLRLQGARQVLVFLSVLIDFKMVIAIAEYFELVRLNIVKGANAFE